MIDLPKSLVCRQEKLAKGEQVLPDILTLSRGKVRVHEFIGVVAEQRETSRIRSTRGPLPDSKSIPMIYQETNTALFLIDDNGKEVYFDFGLIEVPACRQGHRVKVVWITVEGGSNTRYYSLIYNMTTQRYILYEKQIEYVTYELTPGKKVLLKYIPAIILGIALWGMDQWLLGWIVFAWVAFDFYRLNKTMLGMIKVMKDEIEKKR